MNTVKEGAKIGGFLISKDLLLDNFNANSFLKFMLRALIFKRTGVNLNCLFILFIRGTFL